MIVSPARSLEVEAFRRGRTGNVRGTGRPVPQRARPSREDLSPLPRERGVWRGLRRDSEQALMDFRETELARTIADAYQVEETPHVELADVCLVIQPETASVTR